MAAGPHYRPHDRTSRRMGDNGTQAEYLRGVLERYDIPRGTDIEHLAPEEGDTHRP